MGAFGVNVWWTVPKIRCEGERASSALVANGFEERDMPMPTKRTEVSRAAYHFQNRRGKSDRRIVEQGSGTPDGVVVYGILDREEAGDERIEFSQTTTVRYHKDTGLVDVEGALKDKFLAVLPGYKGAVTDQDVRAFLRHVVRMCYGVAKRPRGGIYFVPERFVHLITSAQNVLEAMGTSARLYVEQVVDGPVERQNVWGSVENEIESRLDKTLVFVDRIEKRVSALTQEGKIRELRELMDIYTQILGEEARYEEIASKLGEAERTIAAKMAVIQANMPAPKPSSGRTRNKRSKRLDAAERILKREGHGMNFRALAKAIEENGFGSKAKNPGISMNSALVQDMKKENSRFVRFSRGIYGLAEWE